MSVGLLFISLYLKFFFPLYSFTVLKKAFEAFDSQKSGSIPCDMVGDILRLMGQPYDKKILAELIDEVDADSKFPSFIFNNKFQFGNLWNFVFRIWKVRI